MHIARPFQRTITFTRPSDTTQYTAGDAISDATTTATAATFVMPSMAAFDGGGGVIHSISIHKTDQDLTGFDVDVMFFSSQPVATGWDDNAAIAITDTEWQSCVGGASLVGSSHAASVVNGDYMIRTNLDIVYQCASGSTSLYMVLIARGTYTPASAEVFTVKVGAVVQ